MACGKGFSLGVTAQPGNMQPQMQYQQPPMQQQFAPQMQYQQPMQQQFAPHMQYQQPPMMPVNGYNQASRRRRPGNGLFVTGIIFNALAFLAGVFICVALCAYWVYGTRSKEEVLLIACFFGNPFIITAFILNLISIAKYWSLLPQHFSRGFSPGAAVAFMLIPLFNLYWVCALHLRLGDGLSQIAKRQTPAKGCGTAAAILIFLGIISPFTLPLQIIGYLIGICGYHSAAKVIEP
jgi:hypothetical protein